LAANSQDNPVRIAVDPTDAAASNAALTIVDMLRLAGVEANVVENRMTTIIEDSLPEGEVDAVIAGVDASVTSANMASFFTCQAPEETESTSSTSETTTSPATSTQATERAGAQQQLWSGNLSLACLDEFEATAQSILNGDISAQESLALIREVNREQALYLPLIDETRIRAFDSEDTEASDTTEASDDGEAANDAEAADNAEGDVDDNADHSEKSIIDWHRGIASAPEWEVNNSDE
ncbi:MAG: ABC transporter family substrate-binding protein, partial [Corynebacterium casei]